MVGDLVVVDVVDVDAAGALAHLLGDDGGVEVAAPHVRRRPEGREGPAAVDPRHQVASYLTPGLEAFLDDLGDGADEGAHETLRVGEEPRERTPLADVAAS